MFYALDPVQGYRREPFFGLRHHVPGDFGTPLTLAGHPPASVTNLSASASAFRPVVNRQGVYSDIRRQP
jgi:hypothetical protein